MILFERKNERNSLKFDYIMISMIFLCAPALSKIFFSFDFELKIHHFTVLLRALIAFPEVTLQWNLIDF